MLTRLEYHHLKAMKEWLEQARAAHCEAWNALHELMEKHEHAECGAIQVAHTFTTVTVTAVVHLSWLIESLIEGEDELGNQNREATPEEQEHFNSLMVDLGAQWPSINMAMMGLLHAYQHVGFIMKLDAPKVTVDFDEDLKRPVVVLNDHRHPHLSVVPN